MAEMTKSFFEARTGRYLQSLADPNIYPLALRPCDICHCLVGADTGRVLVIHQVNGTRFACGECRGSINGMQDSESPKNGLLAGWRKDVNGGWIANRVGTKATF